ncbi:RNA polymerase sigma factor [Spirillospora sp. NPDC048911]|uniref:RNA polymerase sigma factor n=1 Tax=Spirillospora sp. NPDC048911 TaxID=3364527 RepID=UPI00371267E6
MIEARRERFEQLYQAHHDEVLRYAARRAGPEHAADVAAETFTIAWRRLDDMPEGAELPWLYVVARNLTANLGRRAARRGETAESFDSPLAHPVEPEHSDAVDRREAALTALRRLSEADRTMIRLVGWEGLDRGQVATALGVSASAATVRLHRTRKRLHELLDPRHPRPFQAIAAAGLVAAAAALAVVAPHLTGVEPMRARSGADAIWTVLRAEGEMDLRTGPPRDDADRLLPLPPALARSAASRTQPCPQWESREANGAAVVSCRQPVLDHAMPVNYMATWNDVQNRYFYQGYASGRVVRLVLKAEQGGGRGLDVPLLGTGMAGIREFGLAVPDTSKGVLHGYDSAGREIYTSQDEDRSGTPI